MEDITELIIDTIGCSINMRKKYGFYSKEEADELLSYYVKAGREIVAIVKNYL